MNRGARRLPIFGTDDDREEFLSHLGRACRRFDVEIHGYALMENHYHLLVRSDVVELGNAMQLVGGTFTQRQNAVYGLDGALFRGRYRSKPILDDRQLRQVLRYIHRNPLEVATGPVTLGLFRWTSHLAYLGVVARPAWLTVDWMLREHFAGCPATLRRFVEDDTDVNVPAVAAFTSPPRPRTLSPTDIERAVGVASEPERALLRQGGRGVRNHLRLASVLLCRELADAPTNEIATRYGFASVNTVYSAISRARSLEQRDTSFALLVADARRRLARSDRHAA
jgi:REP element-mobilizing transposase RayT